MFIKRPFQDWDKGSQAPFQGLAVSVPISEAKPSAASSSGLGSDSEVHRRLPHTTVQHRH